MPFKTLEEANAYKLEMEEKYNSLETAKQGLETKLQEVKSTNGEYSKEINRLKIKNYEYYERITVGKKTIDDNSEPDKDEEQEIKLEDVIKDI